MKFKISQDYFSKALLTSGKSLFSKANLPVLSNILIDASGNSIEVLSTNLETATRVTIEARVEKDGKITVPGKTFMEFVSQLSDKDLTVEKLGEEIVVSNGDYSGRFATMAASEFPAIPQISDGFAIKVPKEEFEKCATRVVFCAAVDEGRPILTGVLCEFGSGALSMVATDGYRLSFDSIELAKSPGTKPTPPVKVVVPARAISEVAKIISENGELKEDLVIQLSANTAQIKFKLGKIEFSSRLIEGEFPNWQKIIPNNFTSKIKVSKGEFARVVKIASIFARDSGNIIRLNFEPNGKAGVLRVIANTNQVGSSEGKINAEIEGKGGEIAFNFRYLADILGVLEGEDVYFEMIESLNPGRITEGEGSGKFFHIIMPVRLQS